MVLSYMGRVLSGAMPYSLPPMPFVPGTNAIGRVVAVGDQVSHVQSGDRVFLSPHLRADVPDPEPPQILIGLTAMATSDAALALQARWRDGVFRGRSRVGRPPASRRSTASKTGPRQN